MLSIGGCEVAVLVGHGNAFGKAEQRAMFLKSSSELVRRQNSALVLAMLRRGHALAHTELCVATGLASATVSAITADLERCGAIERREQQGLSGRGRPRVLLGQRRDFGHVAVIVISSDRIQYSLVDYGTALIDRFSEPRGASDAPALVAAIKAALERLVARSAIDPARLLAVSISSKGLVDPDAPVLRWSPVLGSRSVDFAAVLPPEWPARIILSNETLLVARALFDRMAGEAGGPLQALSALSLGHSVGLGIARRGTATVPDVSAPNFGHMLHLQEGGLCRCGARGCIEAHAGFYAILRSAFEVPKDTIPAKFVPAAEIARIAAQARAGHRRARLAFREAGVALGNGLSRLLSLHGPMPVFLTGPGTAHYDLLQDGIVDGLASTQVVRLGGMPDLIVVPDEAALVFDGHLKLAFSAVDGDIVAARPQVAAQAAGA